ncbi:MAG: alpha/beta hydrolase [Rhodospirillaceae bacterium]|nr:alpha/beta hydrolase [Rhodospirillaceae bacterium]|tara:strand:- start:316 stop:1092 length:777 start_codon:yes stop_codon:yes gene_type:complete
MDLEESQIDVSGVAVDIVSGGSGPQLVFLHGGFGLRGNEAFLQILSDNFSVTAPILPGFGRLDVPRNYNNVDDLAYFCMDLLDILNLENVALVGSCLGGWVAAEMIIRSATRFSNLVLIGSLGMKFSDHLTRDITDIHAVNELELQSLLYAQPDRTLSDLDSLTDDELSAIVRAKESFVLFGWKPYMHNPKLANWAHRISIPTSLIWGAEDKMVTPEYGKKYAKKIKGSNFDLIANAGHYPSIEKPEETSKLIHQFLK